jgi:hypothetical protein
VGAVENYEQAAVRHFEDAEQLAQAGRYDGAGHLIGFAAECAIKYTISSLRPAAQAPYLHLPGLVEVAKKVLQGVRGLPLLEVFRMSDYFAGWSVQGRYHANGAVTESQYRQWHRHTERTLAAAQLRRSVR